MGLSFKQGRCSVTQLLYTCDWYRCFWLLIRRVQLEEIYNYLKSVNYLIIGLGLKTKSQITKRERKFRNTYTLSGHLGFVLSPSAWPDLPKQSYILFELEAPSFPSVYRLCVTLHLYGHSHWHWRSPGEEYLGHLTLTLGTGEDAD